MGLVNEIALNPIIPIDSTESVIQETIEKAIDYIVDEIKLNNFVECSEFYCAETKEESGFQGITIFGKAK